MHLRTRAAVGLVVLALAGSCVGGDGPTSVGEDGTLRIALQPALIPSPADGSALPINRVRTLVLRAADLAVLREQHFDVSPSAASWTLDVDVPVPGASADIVLMVYLLNVAGDGTESVQFSGRSAAVTVGAGDRVSGVDVTIVRGPLSNLDVTGVSIGSAPSTLTVGSRDTLSATATTSGSGAPTIFWTSLAPSVLSMSDSVALGVSAGSAQVVASAGAFADTVSVTVTTAGPAPVDSVRVLPDSAVLAVGGSTTYTAATYDAAGNLLTGRVVSWTTGNGSIATVTTSGLVTGVSPGTTTVRATSEGQFDEGTVRVTTPPTGGAATIRWTKGSNGNWSETTSWDLGRAPVPGDTVRLPGTGYVVTLDVDASVGRVVIDAQLALGARTLTITGAGAGDELDVHPTGILDLANGTVIVADVRSDGVIRTSGGIAQLRASTILMNASASLQVTSGGLLTLAHPTATAFRTSGSVTIGSGSAITFGGTTTTTFAAGSITGTGVLVFQPGAQMVLEANLTLDGPDVSFSASSITPATTQQLSIGPSTVVQMVSSAGPAVIAADVQLAGDLYATGPDSRVGDLTVTASGEVIVDGTVGGTVLATGDVDNLGGIYLFGLGATFGPGSGAGTAIRNGPSGTIDLDPGSDGYTLNGELQNQGTITIQSETRLRRMDSGGAHVSAAHSNSGIIEVMTGGRLIVQLGGTTPTFTNSGTIDVSGATGVFAVAEIAPAAGAFIQSGIGVLTGAGSIDVRGVSTATIGGVVDPGAPSTRRLTWLGNLDLESTSEVDIELAGVFPLTDYDQLFVSDTVALDGALNVLMPNFTPAPGNRFAIMTFAARTANFDAVSFPPFAGVSLDTLWAEAGTTDTLYVVASAVGPAPLNRWINPVSGSWGTAANWSAGTVPAPTDSVVIDVAGTYTVTMSVSDTVAALLIGGSSGQQTLEIANNVPLRFTRPALIQPNGRVYLNGGILSGPGTLTNRGTLTGFYGTFNGPWANEGAFLARGDTRINGAFTTSSASSIRIEGDGTCCGANLYVNTSFTNNGAIDITSANAGTGSNLLVTGTLLNAPGATIVASVGVGGFRSMSGVLDNQGTITVSQPLQVYASGSSSNSGTITIGADVLLNPTTFSNTGDISIAAGRTLTIGGGALNQVAGALGGPGAIVLSNVNANFATAFTTATTGLTLQNSTFNGLGTLTNAAGDTIVVTQSTVAAPLVNQGVLRLRATNTISGTLTSTPTSVISVEGDGTFSAAITTISSDFTNNGLIELTTVAVPTSTELVVTGSLTNADSVVSRVGVGGSRTLTTSLVNQGTLLINQGLALNTGSGASTNIGFLDVSGGDLALTMASGGTFTNTGTATIASGRTWTVMGGTLNQSSGDIGGPGTLALSSTTANFTTDFSNATTRLSLSSTTYNGPGALTNAAGDTIVVTQSTIAAPLVNQGRLRLRATNTISGALTTSATSAISVEGDGTFSAAITTISSDFTNNGLIELTTVTVPTSTELVVTGTLTNADSVVSRVGVGGSRTLTGTLANQGTMLVSQGLALNTGSGASTNSGTVDASGGDLTLTMASGGTFANTGTATIASGRTWTVVGGTLNQVAGTVEGAGTLALSSTTANVTTAFSNATTRLSLTNTTYNGPGTLTNAAGDTIVATQSTIAAPLVNQGLLRLRATNTISGALTTSATSTIRVEGDGTFSAAATTISGGFTNNGLIEITDVSAATSSALSVGGTLVNADSILVSFGVGGSRALNAVVTNQGAFVVSHSLAWAGGTGTSLNSGIIEVSGGDLTYSSGTFTNSGGVDIASGRTWTMSGGTLNQSSGTIAGAGTLALSGTTANFTTPFSNAITRLSVTSSTYNGPGTLTNASGDTIVVTQSTIAAPLVNQGLLRLRATNTISGALTTTSTSVIRAEGDGAFSAAATTVSNGFTNNGVIDITAVNVSTSSGFYLSAGTLTNSSTGIIASTTGVGGPRFFGVAATTLVNQGTLRINQPLTLNGSFTHADNALLEGSSSIDYSGATLGAFDGDVAPGSSPGILSITGNYAPSAASTFRVEINGTTVGSGYDQLAVSGNATLSGSLVVLDTTAFTPSSGNRFAILTAASLTGGFTSVTLPPGLDTLRATAGSVDTLFVTSTGGTPVNSWVDANSGVWDDPARWSLGRVPLSTDSVVIDVPGSYTISMGADGVARSMVLGGATGQQLLLVPTGRTLTLSGPAGSSVGANGRISLGGTINGSSAIANAGVVTLLAGSLATDLSNSGTLIGSGSSSISGALSTTSTSMIRVGQVDGSTSIATLTVLSGFTNNGAIEITNLTAIGAYASQLTVATGTLVNSSTGTIETVAGSSGGGTRALSAALNNQGVILTATGHPLLWSGPTGATHTNSGTIDASLANVTLTMAGAASFTNSGVFTQAAARTFSVSGGTFTLPVGGTLAGGGTFAVSGGTASLQTGFTLNSISATNSTLSFATSVSTASTSISLAGSTLNGAGSVNNAVGQTLTLNASTVNIPVTNLGTLVASGSSAMNGALTTATGSTLRVGQVDGSSSQAQFTVANGFTNNGAIEITNLTNASGYASQLTVTAGTLTNASGASISSLAGTLGGGTRALNAQLNNQVGGTLTTSTGHPLLWSGPSGATHTNSGTVNAAAAVLALTMTGGATFTNTGTITTPTSGLLTITGSGTFTHSAGTLSGTSSGIGLFGGATGVLNAAFSLPLIAVNGSTLTIASGVSTSTTSLTLANATVNGTGSITNDAAQALTMNASTISVPLTNEGTIIASGASFLNGALTTGSNSTIAIGQIDGSTSTANLTVANGFTNNGDIELSNYANFGGYSSQLTVSSGTLTNVSGSTISTSVGLLGGGTRALSARVDNQGTITAGTSAPLIWTGPVGSAHANTGLIDLSAANATLTMIGGSLLNTGTMTVGSGRTFSASGGTFTHGASGTLNGGGAMSFTSMTVGLNAAYTINSITASGVSLNVNTAVITTGAYTFQGGTVVSGIGSLSNGSGNTMTLNASSIGIPFSNFGTLVVSGSSSIGSLTTSAGSTLRIGQIDGGASTAQLTVATGFTNDGTIELTNSSAAGAYSARLAVTSGTLVNGSASQIVSLGGANPGGTRTIAAPVNNLGLINVAGEVGGAAGTLAIQGSLTHQAAAFLALELGGTTPGTQHDQLTVTGAVTSFGGTVYVSTFGGFTPLVGQSFTLLTYGSLLGSLTPTFPPGNWSDNPGPTSYSISLN